jgi:hypothetical protein
MGPLPGPEVRLMLHGAKTEIVKMITAMLAMFQTETIKIQCITCYKRIILELEEDENGEKKILRDVIELVFNFMIFQEDKEINPYLEQLRKEADEIVSEVMANGGKKEARIMVSEEYKQLELPIKK